MAPQTTGMVTPTCYLRLPPSACVSPRTTYSQPLQVRLPVLFAALPSHRSTLLPEIVHPVHPAWDYPVRAKPRKMPELFHTASASSTEMGCVRNEIKNQGIANIYNEDSSGSSQPSESSTCPPDEPEMPPLVKQSMAPEAANVKVSPSSVGSQLDSEQMLAQYPVGVGSTFFNQSYMIDVLLLGHTPTFNRDMSPCTVQTPTMNNGLFSSQIGYSYAPRSWVHVSAMAAVRCRPTIPHSMPSASDACHVPLPCAENNECISAQHPVTVASSGHTLSSSSMSGAQPDSHPSQ